MRLKNNFRWLSGDSADRLFGANPSKGWSFLYYGWNGLPDDGRFTFSIDCNTHAVSADVEADSVTIRCSSLHIKLHAGSYICFNDKDATSWVEAVSVINQCAPIFIGVFASVLTKRKQLDNVLPQRGSYQKMVTLAATRVSEIYDRSGCFGFHET